MEKLEKDDKMAVVYSPGYGAGWSTWECGEVAEYMAMSKDVAEAVLAGDTEKARALAEAKGHEVRGQGAYVCTLGHDSLAVAWVDKGARFRIREYDGSERVEELDKLDCYEAS